MDNRLSVLFSVLQLKYAMHLISALHSYVCNYYHSDSDQSLGTVALS